MKFCVRRVAIPLIGDSTDRLARMSEKVSARDVIQWARLAASSLHDKQAEINELNVFPIPDSDTGSNMSHTMARACSAIDDAIERGDLVLSRVLSSDASPHSRDVDPLTEARVIAQVTSLLAAGAAQGARGNSGMVLSQVFRALADTASTGVIDAEAIVSMLEQAVAFVSTAIASPVEGTVLTVLRESARGGRAALTEKGEDDTSTPVAVVAAALEAAEQALEQTPKQLSILAESGVVDAGGRGLIVILAALHDVLSGTAEVSQDSVPAERLAVAQHVSSVVSSEIEAMFFFAAESDDQEDTFNELREMLAELGNSVIVAPISDQKVKVHVHSAEIGRVIERAYELGAVSELRLEALPPQTSSLAPKKTQRPIIAIVPNEPHSSEPALSNSEGAETHQLGEDIFREAGAMSVDPADLRDPQYAHCLAELVRGEPTIMVLTNGHDPHQVIGALNAGFPGDNGGSRVGIDVIDTQSLVGGLAALAVFDPSKDWEENMEEMTDAVASQRWREVPPAQLAETLAELLEDGGELVTLMTSSPQMRDAVRSQKADICAVHPDVEFHSYYAPGLGEKVQIGVE